MAKVRMNDRRAPTKEVKPPMNNEIEASELRVIYQDDKGKDEALGIMSKAEAVAKAQELGDDLDLILINSNSDPVVCKIVNYSKYRYMLEKKAKEVKKNSKTTEVKEIKMSYKIDIHDYEVRKKNAIKFLQKGDRVKCSVMFRGREVQHDKLGFELLDRLASEMEDICVREAKPKREGRNLSMIVSPRPEVVKKLNESRRASEKAKKKQKTAEKESKLSSKAAAAAVITGASGLSAADVNGDTLIASSAYDDDLDDDDYEDDDDDDDDDDDLDDLDADIDSSLDDLFGSDDLADDLFS
jgi:translation initiation factor IF-3